MSQSQSQNCDDTLNVGKLKEWLRYTSVICLVGAEAPEMAVSNFLNYLLL